MFIVLQLLLIICATMYTLVGTARNWLLEYGHIDRREFMIFAGCMVLLITIMCLMSIQYVSVGLLNDVMWCIITGIYSVGSFCLVRVKAIKLRAKLQK